MNSDAPTSCVFCRILRGELTPGVVALRDELTAVFPSLHQRARNQGHMLVVPTAHVPQIYGIHGEQAAALMTTLGRVATAVKEAFGADGVSIRQNNELHGDQDVFHVHFHVIPRYAGDEFTTGADRYPRSAVELPIALRIEQARKLSASLRT